MVLLLLNVKESKGEGGVARGMEAMLGESNVLFKMVNWLVLEVRFSSSKLIYTIIIKQKNSTLTSQALMSLYVNTKKYHVFAPMGRFQLESIYLYFPPSSQLVYLCFCPVGLSLL